MLTGSWRQSGKTIPGFPELGQLLVFKLNLLQTDSFSGYEQGEPEILNLVLWERCYFDQPKNLHFYGYLHNGFIM